MRIPFFSNKKHKEFYLGLFLKDSQGVVLIFSKENNHLELVDREKFEYTNSWENLTNDVDEVLYKLEKHLKIETKKTIIFVYSHLVDEKIGDIKSVYLQKIKQLTKALDLHPMGYIECFEAISFYLQKEDKISLNAILIEIDKAQLGIFAYSGGKIQSKKILGRTDDIIADLNTGFEEIRKKIMLPTHIVLYDSGNLDDTATKILSHRWSSDFFIQMPKVDILSEDEVINGLMNIFGEQIKDEASASASVKTPADKGENFGFMINEDIGETKPLIEKKKILLLPKINWKIPTFKIKNSLIAIVGVLIIFLGLFINEYFFHKAQLTIFLPTQNLEKNVSINISYRVATSSANFSETTDTTGKQEVGDRAHGSVTIHNFDDKEKIFAKDSLLKTSNLSFVLDSEIKVASSTLTADGSAKLPGKNSGSITASQIGQESNLSKNQRFAFDGLSSTTYFAVNDSALIGGSKKQIQTVSKKDQENLKTIIVNKSKKEIPSIKVLPNEAIASSLSETDFSKTLFSKELGEESSRLNLDATVSMTQYLYDKKIFTDKILTLLRPEVNNDYVLESNNVSYVANKFTNKDNFLTIDANVKAKAVIKISTEEIKNNLLGKNKSKIKEFLKNQYKIDGYSLVINNFLPNLKNYLPFFRKNITLINSSL